MVKGKIKTLAYRSETDLKNYGLTAQGANSIYVSDFESVAAIIGVKMDYSRIYSKRTIDSEIKEARQRVVRNNDGKFEYIPSDEYIRALARIRLKTH